MRLLFIQSSSIFERYGGIEYYLDDFLSLAVEAYGSQNVKSLIPIETPPPITPEYQVEWVSKPRNKILKKISNRYSLGLFKKLNQVCREWKPDLLICGHVHLAPLVYSVSKLHRVPFAVIAYGVECWGDLKPQDEWALRKASQIISISEWTKNRLIQRGIFPLKIQVVSPRLRESFENLPVLEAPKDAFTLMTISRLDPAEQYKGQDHVIKALALLKKRGQLHGIRYWIFGEGPDQKRLEDLVQREELQEIVQFKPKVPTRDDLQKAYPQADVYVMPSRFGKWGGKWRGEGFGIVYAEAGAFRVPTVAYRCGGVLDIVEDGKTGVLVEPDDIEALAQALYDLRSNPKKVKDFGERAYQRVNSTFTKNPVMRQMRQAFDSYGLENA